MNINHYQAVHSLSMSLFLESGSEKKAAFLKVFESSLITDANTGAVGIDAESLQSALTQFVDAKQAGRIAQSLIEGLEDGYAIRTSGEMQPAYPWSVIKNYLYGREIIPPLLISDLGLMDVNSPDEARKVLSEGFVSLPGFLGTPESMDLLVKQINKTREALEKRSIGMFEMRRPGTGPIRDEPVPHGKPPRGNPVPIDSPPVINLSAQGILDCIFKNASWSFLPVITMCLDTNCAEGLANAMSPSIGKDDIKDWLSDLKDALLAGTAAAVTGFAGGFFAMVLLFSLESIYSVSLMAAAREAGSKGACISIAVVPVLWPPYFWISPPIILPRF